MRSSILVVFLASCGHSNLTALDAAAASDSEVADAATDATVLGRCGAAPPGAVALGYDKQAICIAPTLGDISYDATGNTALYSGNYYSTTFPDSSFYSIGTNGELGIKLGAGLMTQRQNSKQGALPYLLAGDGFYVEYAVTLSDNDPDHFPAVWLMPQEHDLAKSDVASTDPAGYERWMEIDCDEGGYANSGSLHTLLSWEGVYPNYTSTLKNNSGQAPHTLDRTSEHIFGVSYDPEGLAVHYWLDGVPAFTASTAAIPAVINTHHYYLIVDAASHGGKLPYTMYVRYESAWIKS